jgi:hypothetical protein
MELGDVSPRAEPEQEFLLAKKFGSPDGGEAGKAGQGSIEIGQHATSGGKRISTYTTGFERGAIVRPLERRQRESKKSKGKAHGIPSLF